ncbi:helix-turn-helix domain-containing protein [Streptomyces sp. NPDC058545]|uniref:helix-turn-helix domain-containing protein n=1 Tax=Streptomyces sp. NPDC058545 TaxID=3346544 RepID=UPI0036614DAA
MPVPLQIFSPCRPSRRARGTRRLAGGGVSQRTLYRYFGTKEDLLCNGYSQPKAR